MKKLLIALMCVLLAGCGAKKTEEPVEKETSKTEYKLNTNSKSGSDYSSADGMIGEFLETYGATLKTVINTADNGPEFDNYDDYNAWYLDECLQPEVDVVAEYVDADFGDDDFSAAVSGLKGALDMMVEHNNDYGVDDEAHDAYYVEQGTYVRGDVLQYFMNNYDFTIPGMEKRLQKIAYVKIYDNTTWEIEDIFNEIYESDGEDGNWYGIDTTTDGISAENTTDYDLKNVQVYMTVTYHDDDEEYSWVDSNVVKSWKKGEVAEFEFDYGPQAFKSDTSLTVYAIFVEDFEIEF